MSTLHQDRKDDHLTPVQRASGWRLAFTESLDDHPDAEIAWEAARWRQHGVTSVAAVCDALLAERRTADQVFPGGAEPVDLDRLLARVDARPVFRLVRDEGLCLLAAMRLVYWAGLCEVGG